MTEHSSTSRGQRVQDTLRKIQQRILRLDFVCSGTLHKRTKICGKSNCRCAKDPSARHGPYVDWSRREEGRLVHTSVSSREARFLRKAITSYKEVLRLLRRWEQETVKYIHSQREET